MEEREKWVQGIVTALWDELAVAKSVPSQWSGGNSISPPTVPTTTPNTPLAGNLKIEMVEIGRTLDAVEARIRQIRETLTAFSEVD